MMRTNFPLINPVKKFSIKHYADHVKEEIEEFEKGETDEQKAKEVIDVLHAAETLVRKFFVQHPEFDIDFIITQIIKKNKERGYYDV